MKVPQLMLAKRVGRFRGDPWVYSSYVAIALAALLPRVLGLGQFITSDEANFWLRRSTAFLQALRSGDYMAMPITSHPGVTTMWLGSVGILSYDGLQRIGLLSAPIFTTRLALLQLPVALTHAAGVLFGYALLRRLLSPRVAVVAALLWAADPFVIAFDRVLHVDGLAGTFSTLCVLAACVYWYHDPRRRWLVASAICAGLALLSKSPSLTLLPTVGMIALAGRREQPTSAVTGQVGSFWSYRSRFRTLTPLLLWSAIVAVTVVASWPALWVNPSRVVEMLWSGVVDEGAQPHMLGNFFLGREDAAPGALFYPAAIALRLTPWTLLGLLLLPLAWRSARTRERHDLAALAGFAVLLVLALSPFPKKFNRYIVPIFPALDILAAYGLAWGAERIASLCRSGTTTTSWTRRVRADALLVKVLLLTLLNVAWWHPYEIAAFNQALGGAPSGARTFTVGWGEGLEQVATWLNQQLDITGVLIASTQVTTLQPYLRSGAQAVAPAESLPDKTGYVVVYVRDAQNGRPGAPFDRFFGRAQPVDTVRIHGVTYAWIYQVPPPVAHARPTDFGAGILLRGYTTISAQAGKSLRMELFWEIREKPASDYTLFAHLLGPDGRHYAQADLPYPTSQWSANRYVTTELNLLLPRNIPSGTYQLVIGLYDPVNGTRLPVKSTSVPTATLDGPNAISLTRVRLK
jgi:4-amino-4-deoxy-L-arabinose transferase-like glycosyltransferase